VNTFLVGVFARIFSKVLQLSLQIILVKKRT
jgi:hypothetical protein